MVCLTVDLSPSLLQQALDLSLQIDEVLSRSPANRFPAMLRNVGSNPGNSKFLRSDMLGTDRAFMKRATPPCELLSTCCTQAGIVANDPIVYCVALPSESPNVIRKVQLSVLVSTMLKP